MDDRRIPDPFIPLQIGEDKNFWSIGTMVPAATINASINSVLWRTGLISSAGLLILIVTVYIISAGITRPVKMINARLKELALGHIRQGQLIKAGGNDEIGEMVHSVNTLVSNLKSKVTFAEEIGSGKFDGEFEPAGADDSLGMALQTMRNNLRQFREEDEKRKWANEGLAQLNDVLRMNYKSHDEFYFNALKTLIYYLRANQGGLFVIVEEEESRYIDLVAAYAYDKKKILSKRMTYGDSLIGQCILEGEAVYIREIPKGYIKITSGLGEATPGVLIIVPLKTDTEAIGAIEIASFREFEQHEIQFIERCCTIIAASVASYRNADRMRALLEKAQMAEETRQSEVFFK